MSTNEIVIPLEELYVEGRNSRQLTMLEFVDPESDKLVSMSSALTFNDNDTRRTPFLGRAHGVRFMTSAR